MYISAVFYFLSKVTMSGVADQTYRFPVWEFTCLVGGKKFSRVQYSPCEVADKLLILTNFTALIIIGRSKAVNFYSV